MTAAQRAKAESFRRLHAGPEPLVLLNVADAGTARLVAAAGFPALATTSAGIAWINGLPDGQAIGRDDMLAAVARIAAAVELPVSADMEAGYGRAPEAVAETVARTIAAGAVGINLEDGTGDRAAPLLEFALAVERIRAAREAADRTGVPLVVNARTDGFLAGGTGAATYDETVRRANAFREAGADCLFVPGVAEPELIGRLVKDIAGPLNVLARPATPPLAALKALGVARVSLGGAPAAAAMAAFRRAAAELQSAGTYGVLAEAISHAELNALMRR